MAAKLLGKYENIFSFSGAFASCNSSRRSEEENDKNISDGGSPYFSLCYLYQYANADSFLWPFCFLKNCCSSRNKEKKLLLEENNVSFVQKHTSLMQCIRMFIYMSCPYFIEEKRARIRLYVVILLSIVSSAISIGFSYFGRDFWTALSKKDVDLFYAELVKFILLLLVASPTLVLLRYMRDMLALEWREWLCKCLMNEYYRKKKFYVIECVHKSNRQVLDNPDQRLTEDVRAFTTVSLKFLLIAFSTVIDFLAFAYILITIDYVLFLACLGYSFVGTYITVCIGKKLVQLNFDLLQKEADFRYSLVRVRENAESIAFYGGECIETKENKRRLYRVVSTLKNIINVEKNLEFFTTTYKYIIQVLPTSIIAPRYFSGKVELGVVSQSFGAFNHILNDMSVFINQFEAIAAFYAGLDRLVQFTEVLQDRKYACDINFCCNKKRKEAKDCSGNPSMMTIMSKDVDLQEEPSTEDSEEIEEWEREDEGNKKKSADDGIYLQIVKSCICNFISSLCNCVCAITFLCKKKRKTIDFGTFAKVDSTVKLEDQELKKEQNEIRKDARSMDSLLIAKRKLRNKYFSALTSKNNIKKNITVKQKRNHFSFCAFFNRNIFNKHAKLKANEMREGIPHLNLYPIKDNHEQDKNIEIHAHKLVGSDFSLDNHDIYYQNVDENLNFTFPLHLDSKNKKLDLIKISRLSEEEEIFFSTKANVRHRQKEDIFFFNAKSKRNMKFAQKEEGEKREGEEREGEKREGEKGEGEKGEREEREREERKKKEKVKEEKDGKKRRVWEEKKLGDAIANYRSDTSTSSESVSTTEKKRSYETNGMVKNKKKEDHNINNEEVNSSILLILENLRVVLPETNRVLVENLNLCLRSGDYLLITGGSGVGKSTILRSIAGLWRYGSGHIRKLYNEEIFFFPQKPYCTLGSLREQLLYPNFLQKQHARSTNRGDCAPPTEEELISILKAVNLERTYIDIAATCSTANAMDSIREWSSILSLGEQQRLAFARLLVNKKYIKMVILDEATSALDVNNEKLMYELLLQTQTNSKKLAIISVGHRKSLEKFHNMKLNVLNSSDYSLTRI